MFHVLLDFLLIGILGFCVWQGYRKGLVLTLAGVLVLLLAVWGASAVSRRYAEDFEQRVSPLFGWVSDEAAEVAMRDNGYSADNTDEEVTLRVAAGAFAGMGVVEKEADKLAAMALEYMRETRATLKAGVSNTFIHIICRVLLFLFSFAVIALLLTLLAHFASMLVKIPGLKQLDTVGGLAAGLVYGLLILFAIGWGLRFLGIIVPMELIEDTFLLRFFVKSNPLALFL